MRDNYPKHSPFSKYFGVYKPDYTYTFPELMMKNKVAPSPFLKMYLSLATLYLLINLMSSYLSVWHNP